MVTGRRTKNRAGLLAAGAAVLALVCIDLSASFHAARAEEPAKPVAKKYRKSRLTHDEAEAIADRRKLLLSSGEDKVVDLDFDIGGDKFISIGNPTLVTYQIVNVGGQRRQIVFKPLKSGDTTVTVRNEEGTIQLIFDIRVTNSNLLRKAAELRELLKDVEGIDIRIVGEKIIIDGQVLVPADYGRILMLTAAKQPYESFTLNMTTISPLAMQVLSKRIQDDVNAFAPNVKTRVVNGVIFLEGTVDNKDQADRVAAVAAIYLPEVRPLAQLAEISNTAQSVPNRKLIQNFIVINAPPPKKQEKLVRVTVHFVELSKDYNKVFGFKWEPTITNGSQLTIGQGAAGSGTTDSGSNFTATIDHLLPKLNSANAAGFARVLKTGTIMTRSGQPAELNEQTEFPYQMIGANGVAQAAKVGVGLTIGVTPMILGQSEDIQLEVDLNQTNLTGTAPAAGSAPITAQHHVKSKVYVKNNESAALAAVSSSDVGTDFNKDDPMPAGTYEAGTQPLFSLLRSKAYRKKKSQFVIFITPQIIENASDGTDDLKKNFRVKVK